MVSYNTIEGIKNYRDHPAVSQSELKAKMINRKFSGGGLAMLMGNYIDCRVTMKDEDLDKLFMFAGAKRPSENISTLVEQFKWTIELNSTPIQDLSNYQVALEKFLENKDFYPNLSIDKRVLNFINKANEWWNFLIENDGKSIVSIKEKTRMDTIYFRLKNEVLDRLKGDIYYQKELYWTTKIDDVSIESKGLADIILEKEDSVWEIDLKFTECKDLSSWFYVMRDKNYAIQKAYYRMGLESYGKRINQMWLVVSEHFTHMVPCTSLMLDIGMNGYDKVDVYEFGKEARAVKRHSWGVKDLVKNWVTEKDPLPLMISEEQSDKLFL